MRAFYMGYGGTEIIYVTHKQIGAAVGQIYGEEKCTAR
jgi:hypothetical protein